MHSGLPARQIFMRLLCALSLALLAFGHTPLQLPRAGTLAAQAFPDGSRPVICLTDSAGKSDRKQGHHHDCDACRVSASFLFQPAECARSPTPAGVRNPAPLPSPPLVERAVYPPAAPPQAPPLPA
jgi:hypothetical protein